jgi:hypothetical protein
MTDQLKHRARIVRNAIESIEAKLESDNIKPTIGDLVRLLQIEKELDTDEPREIRVRWVDGDTKGTLSKM